ncbi:replication restart helicase PriA [Agathobaculum sp. LCP25S3_E8]|uniref:replication restart helicase PriA n=1 Tax=Agathobaculum sp. LCP25S3_E8 TaxID=3438735 RepID=UPI003F8F251B
MTEHICAVAVDAATYAIDKLYSYRVPDELREQVQIGTRVLVPFGFGNKRAEAVVLAFREDAGGHKLKPVIEVLDDTPILTAQQLKLAAWMRERLYCTFFDCVHVMLPAGLWFKRNETYTLAPDVDLAALRQRDGDAGRVLALFDQPGQTLAVSDVRQRLGGKSVTRVLDALTGEGVLIYHSNTVQKSGDKTEKMLALDMEAGEAMARISRRSPARLDVVSVLADGGWMSQKELVYMTGVTDAALRDMVKKGILRARQEERLRTPDFSEVPPAPLPVLSEQQQQAYDGLAALMDENAPRAALLFGVTGSGKTQVYLKLIAHALEQGKSAIVLVPEIGLTPQVMRQFAAQFGDAVAVLHSALSAGERYDSFKKIKSGRARVVVGTRSAVFAPVEHLGVLILDEEQDGAYKSEQSPRYHARDVAKYRAAHESALLVLGSATPSVETYYGAKQGKYPVFSLTERFMGASLPEVQIADLRGQAREGRSGVIGQQLESELIDTLNRGKQSILFLNRRGNSRVIGCALCGWVPECPSCSTSMTYHSASGRAMCHYCGASIKITGTCPVCGGTSLFTETPGTQRVEQELHEKFPSARVLRMDADTMTTKGAHEKLLTQFAKGGADILLGTQMVTKGLDFENVTLVGVLDADQSLYAQDYRARERTFSLITQVVGRAGRRFDTGKAVIQTYSPTHSVILTAARQDYEAFYEREMETRQALQCPPMCDLTVLTAVGEVEQQVLASLLSLKTRLQSLMEGQYTDVKAPVLGPAAAQVVKVMGRYRYHLTMRAQNTARWRALIAGVMREFLQDSKNRGITLFADENPDL